MLHASGSYGGYPEDLAQAAADLGYDILIVRGSGDDQQAYHMSTLFWRRLKCPIPVYRIGSIHEQQLRLINASQLVRISSDPNPSALVDSVGALLFIFQCIFIPACLFCLSGKKFRELYRSGMKWTTGTAVTVVCGAEGVFQFIIGVQYSLSFSSFRGFSFVGISAFGFWFSAVYRFNLSGRLSLSCGDGSNEWNERPSSSKPLENCRYRKYCARRSALLRWLAICNQTPTTVLGWYNIASVYYSVFRLAISSYFIWGHLYVLKVLKISSGALGSEGVSRLSNMSSRLFITALLTLASPMLTEHQCEQSGRYEPGAMQKKMCENLKNSGCSLVRTLFM
jgi:hypothetical protein